MFYRIVFASLLASVTKALQLTSIRWGGIPFRRFALEPRFSPNGGSDTSHQTLTIQERLDGKSTENIPRFAPQSAHTITWGGMCIDAGGDTVSNAVRIQPCTGGISQLWEFLPAGSAGMKKIQLKNTNRCIGIDFHDQGGPNGAAVRLCECDDDETAASWTLEEAHSHLQEILRHAFTYVIALAGLGAVGLSAWSWQAPKKIARPAIVNVSVNMDQTGVCLTQLSVDSWSCLNDVPATANSAHSAMPAVMVVNPMPDICSEENIGQCEKFIEQKTAAKDEGGNASLKPATIVEEFGSRQERRKHLRKERARWRKHLQKEKKRKTEAVAVLGVLKALQDFVPKLSAPLEECLAIANVEPADRHSAGRICPFEEANKAQLRVDNLAKALKLVEEAFATDQPYGSLPEVFAPPEVVPLLGSIIDRSDIYNKKHLPQEASLVTKVWSLVKGAGAFDTDRNPDGQLAVVDIGAGNGCLALLAATVLDAYAVLIDHTLPPKELRVECNLPEPYRSKILRINCDVANLDLRRDLEPLLQSYNIKSVVVVAKHLCGVGTDLSLDLLSRWQDTNKASDARCNVSLLGAVFATCCGHKIRSDAETYARIHQSDAYLGRLVDGDACKLHGLVDLCTPCVSWRTSAALGERIMPLQVRAAEMFENALQQPRLNKLRSIFPMAAEVAYVSTACSKQNRCILAGSHEGIRLCLDPDMAEEAVVAIRSACNGVLSKTAGTPFVFKPNKEFVAARRALSKELRRSRKVGEGHRQEICGREASSQQRTETMAKSQ